MTEVGEYYGEATETSIIETEYGDFPVRIKYNYWSSGEVECVTQRFDTPTNLSHAQYSLYEWLQRKAKECMALEQEGFYVTEAFDNVVIWERSAR